MLEVSISKNVQLVPLSSALGSPHLYVWRALSTSLTQVHNADTVDVQIVRKYLSLDLEGLSPIVQVCRANTIYDKKSVKITLISASEHFALQKATIQLLQLQGGTVKFGSAPKSRLERDVSKAFQVFSRILT